MKAILKTGTGSGVSVLFGMLAVKLIASRLGSEGLGTFSLVRQVVVAGSAMFLTGGQTALVQGMASRTGDDRERYVSTAMVLLCGGSLSLSCLMLVAAGLLGPWLLPRLEADSILTLRLAAIAVAFSGPLSFLYGVLNGLRQIGRLAVAQALGSAALALFVWIAIPFLQSESAIGAALVLAVAPVPAIATAGYLVLRTREVRLRLIVNPAAVRHMGRIAAATVAGAGMQAWTVLILRSSIATRLGLKSAGLFDAGWTISMVYVMLVLSSFSTYYLPTLSGSCDRNRLLNNVLRTTLLFAVPLIAFMTALRPFVITTLYSREFLPAVGMMHWMLLGDCLKIISFVVAMPMLALADIRAFLAGEVGWNILMIAGSLSALRVLGKLEAVGVVFVGAYMAYGIYAFVYCSRTLGWRWPRELGAPGLVAIATLGAVSAAAWRSLRVEPIAVLIALLGSALQGYMILRPRVAKGPLRVLWGAEG